MPVIIKRIDNIKDNMQEIERIYNDFPDKSDLVASFQASLDKSGVYYAGEFNSKIIAGALVEEQEGKRVLTHLAVHQATRGRGVGKRVLEEVARLESETNATKLYAVESISSGEFNSVLREAGFASDELDGLLSIDLSIFKGSV